MKVRKRHLRALLVLAACVVSLAVSACDDGGGGGAGAGGAGAASSGTPSGSGGRGPGSGSGGMDGSGGSGNAADRGARAATAARADRGGSGGDGGTGGSGGSGGAGGGQGGSGGSGSGGGGSGCAPPGPGSMNGEHVWSRSFGVPRPQVGTAIAAWGSEVILAGHFQGTLNTHASPLSVGGDDVFVARIKLDGPDPMWKRFGGNGVSSAPPASRPTDPPASWWSATSRAPSISAAARS